MNKYIERLTTSPRGERFNPLIYPFFVATLFYGLGFLLLGGETGVKDSSLHAAMLSLGGYVPLLWGAAALTAIVLGVVFLLTQKKTIARLSAMVGFMVWVFAAGGWLFTGGWLLIFTVATPNIYFWVWQYFSLSEFQREAAYDLDQSD
jgi:hypothetical protein